VLPDVAGSDDAARWIAAVVVHGDGETAHGDHLEDADLVDFRVVIATKQSHFISGYDVVGNLRRDDARIASSGHDPTNFELCIRANAVLHLPNVRLEMAKVRASGELKGVRARVFAGHDVGIGLTVKEQRANVRLAGGPHIPLQAEVRQVVRSRLATGISPVSRRRNPHRVDLLDAASDDGDVFGEHGGAERHQRIAERSASPRRQRIVGMVETLRPTGRACAQAVDGCRLLIEEHGKLKHDRIVSRYCE